MCLFGLPQTKLHIGKSSDKKLVTQPILKQIVDLVPREIFDKLVLEQDSDRYYKRFDSWTQFVSLLYGLLSRCDSTTEIASGMQALQGKLNDLGSRLLQPKVR